MTFSKQKLIITEEAKGNTQDAGELYQKNSAWTNLKN